MDVPKPLSPQINLYCRWSTHIGLLLRRTWGCWRLNSQAASFPCFCWTGGWPLRLLLARLESVFTADPFFSERLLVKTGHATVNWRLRSEPPQKESFGSIQATTDEGTPDKSVCNTITSRGGSGLTLITDYKKAHELLPGEIQQLEKQLLPQNHNTRYDTLML